MKLPRAHAATRPAQAWTLIETLGSLAVLALLASLVLPILLRELDRAARDQERRELSRIAQASREWVTRSGQVPDPQSYAAWLEVYGSWSQAGILTNARGVRRAVVFDPRWRTGASPGSPVPWVQIASGSVHPESTRWMLVSSLGEPLPDFLSSPSGIAPASFDALWSTSAGTIPVDWEWAGRAEDLLIDRIDLRDELVPVVFSSPEGRRPEIGLGTNRWNLEEPFMERWYLRGTPLRLGDELGTAQVIERIAGARCWQYSGGKWRQCGAWNERPTTPSGRDVAELAEALVRAPLRPGVDPNAPAHLVGAIGEFQSAYEDWVASGSPAPVLEGTRLHAAWTSLKFATRVLMEEP